MKMELGLRPRLEQKLRLAPQIIQSIEILQLPLLALQARIEQEQNENPVLEVAPEAEDPPAPDEVQPKRTKDEAPSTGEEDFSRLENLDEDFREYFWQSGRRGRGGREAADQKQEALQNTPSRGQTLQEHLLDQLRLTEVQPRLAAAAEAIIHNIDRDGRLRVDLSEVLAGMDEPVTPEEMQAALHVVQSFEPRGVAARTLAECLLLQLDPQHPDYPLLERLVRDHLEDLENNRLPKVARALEIPLDRLKELITWIGHLDPTPGAVFDSAEVPYVIPDVLVELVDGRYEVYLNDTFLPRLRVSPTYRRMLRRVRRGSKEHAFLRSRVESARWLVDAIEQRKDTLLRIAREIVRVQEGFLECGVAGLKPLKMQEVADATGVHVSTVSRAISQKYMQTPQGIYPLKYFFSGGMPTADGADETWSAIKERLRRIVDEEDKRRPLSDEEIARKLAESGVQVARRTVTKYRKQLGIPSSRRRKAY